MYVIFGGDTDRNHHNATFSIPVSSLHQSSWKLCIYFYLSFSELLPEHHLLQADIVHILHSLVGSNQSLAKFCAHSEIFAMWNSVKKIELPVFHHSSLTISLQNPCTKYIFLICERISHFDYDRNATQHNHTSLDSVEARTGSSSVEFQQLQFSALELYSIMVSNRPIVYWTSTR
jgi:hypothetical protein